LGENCFRKFWGLDEGIVFLNHGSFGAAPLKVLEKQREIRELIEREPVKFFMRDFEALYEEAQVSLASLVGCRGEDIVFVPNATTGVNIALRSLQLSKGDEILVTNQEYNACRNALDETAKDGGFTVKVIGMPFPVNSSGEIVELVLNSISSRTRALLIDHIVSQTALILDVEKISRELSKKGIETIIDGAHSLGMVRLELDKLKPAFYTSNAHKWLCAPKGSAFLYTRKDLQKLTRPLVISHGANSPRTDKSRYFLEFSWMGTHDPSPYLSIPAAIDFLNSLMPGGITELMQRNRLLCLEARDLISDELQIEIPCPDEMVGAMASFPIKDATIEPKPPIFIDDLQDDLFCKFNIEIPVMYWPAFPKRLLRISSQAYNSIEDYQKLCKALKKSL
jgi:isopenicillin-N epimerase